MPHQLRITAKLDLHLPEGYSKVRLELGGGIGLAGGPIDWDIPTRCIPPQLRKIGSRFIVISTGLAGPLEVKDMAPEQMRSSMGVRVLELSKGDESTSLRGAAAKYMWPPEGGRYMGWKWS